MRQISSKSQLHRARGEMQAVAPRALLFAGFACNAVSFLFRPSNAFAPTYVVGMGLAFMSGLYVSLCDTAINYCLTALGSESMQLRFIRQSRTLSARMYTASLGYVGFF